MADLSTTYLGLHLKNPLVVSSIPLSEKIENLQRMEAKGAAAIILPSLFEEQIELQNLGRGLPTAMLPAELQHIPDMQAYNQGANGYLAYLFQAKKAVNIPIIGSLNGYYGGGWVQYGRLIEAAGADALELNMYYLASKPHIDGGDIEKMYLDLAASVKSAVRIPVAIKLNPYFTAMANMAYKLDQTGVHGMVLFNRFYQPDFDLETQTILPSLNLSESSELRLRLRWVSILSPHLKADLAITGGIHTAKDVLKGLMAGAKVTMMASALLQHGIDHLATVLAGVNLWLDDHNIDSVKSLIGRMSQEQVADPAALERANYMNVLKSYGEK